MTCAQALLKNADPKSVLKDEKFLKDSANTAAVAGLWSAT